MKSSKSSFFLVILGLLLPSIAATMSRRGLHKGYEKVFDREAPVNPASRDVDWGEAVVWTVAGGIVAGLSRLLVRRALAPSPIPAEGDDDTIDVDLPDLDIT